MSNTNKRIFLSPPFVGAAERGAQIRRRGVERNGGD